MTNRATFLRLWTEYLSPRWALGRYGSRLFGTLALTHDLQAEAARQVVRARYPDGETADEHVVAIGQSRRLERIPGETPANHLSRVTDHWEQHRLAATKSGVEDLFHAAGYDAELVLTTWPAYQIRVWGLPCTPPATWGSGPLWGDVALTWGGHLAWQDALVLRDIARMYLPAKLRFTGFVCPEPEDAFGDLEHCYRAVNSGTWTDRIGSDDATGGTMASYTASDAGFGGWPTAVVSAPPSASISTQSTEGTLYAVARDALPLAVSYVAGIDRRGLAWMSNTSDRPFGDDDGSAKSGVSKLVLFPARPRCVIYTWVGTSHTLWVDGVVEFQGAGSSINSGNLDLYLGASESGTFVFGGAIAEIGYSQTAITSTESRLLSRYARDRYGVPYVGTPTPDLWAAGNTA